MRYVAPQSYFVPGFIATFPWSMMGWGPGSPSHYAAPTGAAVGVALLLAAGMLRWLQSKRAGVG